MKHKAYTRQGTGTTAVLMIHGIAGSPDHFRDLVPVIPPKYSIYNILLDGHSGTVREFSRSSMDKWKEQVQSTLNHLFEKYTNVVIVAHSMGTLFAISSAIQYPDRIPALFLLAVPTRIRMPLSTWITCLRVAFGKLDTPKAQAMHGDTGIQLTPRLWEYIGWMPRMVDLLRECRRVRKIIPLLTVPTLAFQSQADELVSTRSCEDLNHPCIRLTVLEDSGHFVYGKEDALLLQKQLLETLDDLTKKKTEI